MAVSGYTEVFRIKIKMNRKFLRDTVVFFVFTCYVAGCSPQEKKATVTDSPRNGSINISLYESFRPVIEEQIKVYEASYPATKINAVYKPEADCFRDLENDSIRMVVVASELTHEQNKFFDAKLNYMPLYDVLAYDAVCAIINKESSDSVFSINKIQSLLSGKDTSLYVVLDGNKATSTVRYLIDSVLKGSSVFGSNVMAAANSRGVIDYVSSHKNAIGFVGSSWVLNSQDPEQVAYQKNIKMALLQCKHHCEEGEYARPSQYTITYNQYPLVRPLYFILKERFTGLGTGFTNYLSYERGQLVFRRSFLVPGKMDFRVRKGLLSK